MWRYQEGAPYFLKMKLMQFLSIISDLLFSPLFFRLSPLTTSDERRPRRSWMDDDDPVNHIFFILA
jgi:hypothetical protein